MTVVQVPQKLDLKVIKLNVVVYKAKKKLAGRNMVKTQHGAADSSCAAVVSSKAAFSEETVSEEHRNLASEWMHEVVIDSEVKPEVIFFILWLNLKWQNISI